MVPPTARPQLSAKHLWPAPMKVIVLVSPLLKVGLRGRIPVGGIAGDGGRVALVLHVVDGAALVLAKVRLGPRGVMEHLVGREKQRGADDAQNGVGRRLAQPRLRHVPGLVRRHALRRGHVPDQARPRLGGGAASEETGSVHDLSLSN